MERRSGSTKLAPTGFVVEHAEIDTDCVFLDVRATALSATARAAGPVHSGPRADISDKPPICRSPVGGFSCG